MSYKTKGTDVIFEYLDGPAIGEIVGQGDMTHTQNGDLVEISNRSLGDDVTYMDEERANKQHVLQGDLTYNTHETYRQVLADAEVGKQRLMRITYPGSGEVTDESFEGLFVPHAVGRNINRGQAVTTAITFSSSGPVTRTPASDA